jgi:hypothetical protein
MITILSVVATPGVITTMMVVMLAHDAYRRHQR